jgi:hypothetical protein
MAFKMRGFSPFDSNHETNPKKDGTVGTNVGQKTTSGIPGTFKTASGTTVKSSDVDEGNLSGVKTNDKGQKFVVVQEATDRFPAGTKLFIN